jgi:hypothetical protein
VLVKIYILLKTHFVLEHRVVQTIVRTLVLEENRVLFWEEHSERFTNFNVFM